MVRYGTTIIGAALLGVLIGCSGFDSTQILVHPDSVVTSGTVDVALVNLYTYIDTAGSVISQDVTRDSLHLLVGLPPSWDVTEAKAVVVDDMTTSELLALQGSLIDETTAAALLAEYQSEAAALSADDGVAEALAGNTIDAHGADGNISVAVDDLEQTRSYSAPVNITITEGSTADTTLSLDSIITFIESTGMVPDSTMESMQSLTNIPGISMPDSVGIVMVPVFVFLKLKAADQEGDATLYYFSKTGAMDQEPSSIITMITLLSPEMGPMLSGIESGDMTYMPVTVNDGAGTVLHRSGVDFSGTTVTSDRAAGSVRINLGNMADPSTVISVYSLQGNLVTTLGPPAAQREHIVWNGTDFSGGRVKAGTYIFRLEGKTANRQYTATLMR